MQSTNNFIIIFTFFLWHSQVMYIYLHYPPFLSDILFIYNPQDLSDTTIADSQVASSKFKLKNYQFFGVLTFVRD